MMEVNQIINERLRSEKTPKNFKTFRTHEKVIFFVNIFDEDLLLISIFKSLDLSLEIPKTKLPEGEILRGFSSRKILSEGLVLPIINPP